MPDPLENNIINKILLHVNNPSKLNIMENIVTVYETFLAYYSVGYILLYLILILSWIAIRRYFQSKYFLPKEILIKSNHTVEYPL
jgi:hypothetical protein